MIRPHGIRGEVVVEVLSDAPDRFSAGAVVGVGDPEGIVDDLVVRSSRWHKGRMLIAFDGVDDRNAAEMLRGSFLSVPASGARPPEPGRYYAHQLEGLDVVDTAGEPLGVMTGVLENPANDLWVVRTPDGKEFLVPAVRQIVRSVELDVGRIVLDPIPGLFD